MTEPYYQDPRVTLYHGDAYELLAELQADHVITDPPYDANTHAKADIGFRGYKNRIGFEPCDVTMTVPALLASARRWVVAFCALEMVGAYRDAAGDAWVRCGFWRKPNGAPQFTGDRPGQPGEGLAIMHRKGKKRWNGGGTHAFWDTPMETFGRQHPAEKPVALMRDIIADFVDAGESILDPFAGSGTTLVAASLEGCEAIGIEQDERYCEIAAKRLAQGCLPFPPKTNANIGS